MGVGGVDGYTMFDKWSLTIQHCTGGSPIMPINWSGTLPPYFPNYLTNGSVSGMNQSWDFVGRWTMAAGQIQPYILFWSQNYNSSTKPISIYECISGTNYLGGINDSEQIVGGITIRLHIEWYKSSRQCSHHHASP